MFVRASELPRGALVEYQTNMNTGRQGCDDMVSDADQEVDESELEGEYASGDVRGTYWETCRAPAGRTGNRAAIFIPGKLQTGSALARGPLTCRRRCHQLPPSYPWHFCTSFPRYSHSRLPPSLGPASYR